MRMKPVTLVVIGSLAFVMSVLTLVGLEYYSRTATLQRELRAETPAPVSGVDPYDFAPKFHAELRKVGELSTSEFSQLYPRPEYRKHLSWDPAKAKFFDRLNAETITKPGEIVKREGEPDKRNDDIRLPGYKLTPEELELYQKNGFVVSERLGGYSFGQLYYDIYTRDLPVFITADSVLHAWHRSYDAMLEELEVTHLKPTLTILLTKMHDSIPAANTEYGEGILKDSVLDSDYFLTVALRLLNQQAKSKLGQEARVTETLKHVESKQFVGEIRLFGRERPIDGSQFKPRGHYETNPGLRDYFQAMIWCGRIDFRVGGGRDGNGELSDPRELGAAMVLLDLLRRGEQEEPWRQFDRLIQTFVGKTDSTTFDDLAKVAKAAKVDSPASLKTEEDLKKLTDAVMGSDAGKQNIRGDAYLEIDGTQKVSLPRSFTVMGQKFVVDSFVTTKVVFDDIQWRGEKVNRRVPHALDVSFAAFGNNHVVPEIVNRIKTGKQRNRDQMPYQHNLAAVRNVIDNVDPKAWNDTIYMAWLKTLRTLTAKGDDRLPESMRTHEWAMKQTNTQLASWTQLRHDTILYVKQSHYVKYSCYYPAGFVEPNVPFWEQMEAMAKRSAGLLEQTPFPDIQKQTQKKQIEFFKKFAIQMGKLKSIAGKQLAQQELTAEETKVLQDVMQIEHGRSCGASPRYNGWYPALFYKGTSDCVKWDALVADVHTDSPGDGNPGSVLHQGVGNVDMCIVAIDNGKDRVVYAGPTFSHYEFALTGLERRSDTEWKEELLEGKVPPRPNWTKGYLVPMKDREPIDAKVKEALLKD